MTKKLNTNTEVFVSANTLYTSSDGTISSSTGTRLKVLDSIFRQFVKERKISHMHLNTWQYMYIHFWGVWN